MAKETRHETGAKELILAPDEITDLKELVKIKRAKKAKHTDLTDTEVKRLVFAMAKILKLL